MSNSGEVGSVHLAGSRPPSGEVGVVTFDGSLRGTSRAAHEACEKSGSSFQHFTLTATGDINGRTYFLSASIYPYRGPDSYELRPLPPSAGDYLSTPNPLVEEAPGGYPGFLNFVPKSDPGNAYSGLPSGTVTSAMAVDASEQSGWFDLQLVAINGKVGTQTKLRVSGKFLCGEPFQI